MALNRENLEALTGLSSKDASSLPRESADIAGQQQGHPETAPRPERTPGYEPSRQFRNPALSESAYDPERDPRRLQDIDATRESGESDPSQPKPDKPPMMVPNTRLTEEADKRRAADERYSELKANHERLNERFSMMLEAWNANQERKVEPQAPTLPDPEEDLPGYLKAMNERYESRERELTGKISALEQQGQLQTQIQSVQQRAMADEAAFAQSTPDFRNAYNWWRQGQVEELTAMGVDARLAQQHVDTMELQISAMAQQQGQNSAERFYRAAQARGWKGQQGVVSHQTPVRETQQVLSRTHETQNVTPIEQHPQYQQQFEPMAQQPQYQPQAQTLENMNAGMMESRSLDEASQGGTAMPMDLNTIANMSDAEFMERYESLMPRIRSALG